MVLFLSFQQNEDIQPWNLKNTRQMRHPKNDKSRKKMY